MSKAKDPTITETLRAYESMAPEEQLRRYRGLLKSHRQLEARVREDDRATQWWKGRTEVLDTRARELGAKLGAALNENKALMKTVGLLEAEAATNAMTVAEAGRREETKDKENGRHSKGVNAGTQTDPWEESQKDIVIKRMLKTLWNTQSGSATISATCGCESARALRTIFLGGNSLGKVTEEDDPLGAMLARRKIRRGSGSRSGSLEERGSTPITVGQISLASKTKTTSNTKTASTTRTTSTTKATPDMSGAVIKLRSTSQASEALTDTALTIEIPPHSYPEMFLTARKERKQALKMKLRATREMVEGLRKENGVLEGLLGEGGGGEVNRMEWRG